MKELNTLVWLSILLVRMPSLLAENPDIRHSPFVPDGYHCAFSSEFDNSQAKFNPIDHPQFTTANFRLNGRNDLNTIRRLGNNHELQLYLDEDFEYNGLKLAINPFSIQNDILKITAAPLPEEIHQILQPLGTAKLPPPRYSSGMLSTETEGRNGKGYKQLYGYWELRAKLPKGKGLWPAFWLVTETHDYWDEVDILEVLGHEPDAIYHSTHFHDGGGTDGLPWAKRISHTVDTADGFHVYGMHITKDTLAYSVDGEITLQVPHTLETELYTIINLAVGGRWPGNPNTDTQFPATMEIDYLRIYKPEY